MMTSRLVWTAVIAAGLAGSGCDAGLRLGAIGLHMATGRPNSPSPGTSPLGSDTTQLRPDGSQSPASAPPRPDPGPVDVAAVTDNAIFIEPAPPEERTIYLDVRSGIEEFDQRAFKDFVVEQFKKNDKGYQVVDNPKKAHFYLVANVLNLKSNKPLTPGAHRQEVDWVLDCEIQVKELAGEDEKVSTRMESARRNGNGTAVTETAVGTSKRKEYRTKITTTAKGIDLEFENAQQAMFRKTAFKLSGFF